MRLGLICAILIAIIVDLYIVLTPKPHHKISHHKVPRIILKHEVKIPTRKCNRKPVTVAIIDTGFGMDLNAKYGKFLCKYGHKNFVNDDNTYRFGTKTPVPVDRLGHGTNIAGLIQKYASRYDECFCMVILEYYSSSSPGENNLLHTIQAINYARRIHANFINYSGGGNDPSKREIRAVKRYIDSGGVFVAAAGNDGKNLAKAHFYPAQDDPRVIVVGNGYSQKLRASTSNYGKRVNIWRNGTNRLGYNLRMTGTSQATAIETGILIAKRNRLIDTILKNSKSKK